MALTVDTIESILKARTGDYIRDMNAATSAYEKWRNAQNGEQAVTDKVERASTRRATAKRREVETEVQAQTRIAAAVDRGIAKREQEATAAERAADRIVRAGSKAATANQTRLMSTTSLGAVPGQGPVDTVNYALRDQIDLRNKLRIATIAGDQAAVDGIQDQLTYLANLRTFKQAGLDDTQAAIRAEQGLQDVIQARAAQEARISSQGIAASGRQANAVRNLGRQFQDIGVGLVGGQGLFLVLAQQIPQVADAVTDLGKRTGIAGAAIKTLTFFATPTGAILLAAASAAAVFGSRMFESSKSVDSLVASLQKEYKESQASDEAKKRFGDTLEGVTKAVIDQKNALDELAKSDKSAAEQANISANAALNKALAIREATAAAAAAARDEANGFALGITGSAGSTVAQIAGADQRRIAAEKRAAEAEAALVISRSNVDRTRANLASEQATREAARRSDPSERIRIDSEETIKNLRIANTNAIIAANGNLKEQQRLSNELADSIDRVNRKRDADLKKIQESNKEIGKTNRLILESPVSGGRVTSGIGARTRPTAGASTNHAGTDIAVPIGTPVSAGASGVVISAGRLGGFGNAIVIDYGGGTIAKYGHLSQLAVRSGQRVEAGEQIGLSGNSGVSTGPHLHYEVRTNGRVVDPRNPVRVGDQAKAEARDAAQEQRDREQAAKERKDTQQRLDDRIYALGDRYVELTAERNVTIEQQIAQEKDAVDRRLAADIRDIENDEKLSVAQKARAERYTRSIAKVEKANIEQDGAEKIAERERLIGERLLSIRQDALSAESELVTNRAARYAVEQRLLELSQAEERRALERQLDDDKITGVRRERALSDLGRKQNAQSTGLRNQYASPLERFRSEISQASENINDELESIQVRGLESLNDKLSDTISNVFKLGGAFGEIANQIISDLIRIAVQQAIIKPLAGALFGGGAGGGGNSLVADPREDANILKSLGGSILGGGGGIGGAIVGILGGLFGGKRAVGGTVSAGSLYRVNEQGTEGYASFSQPGRIIPLGEMNTRSQGNTTIVQQTIALDARYGITTPELINYVNQVGRTAATQGASYGAKIAVKAAPGAAATQRRFGG